jgi:single-stranded DNA-binding protein|tara:strand:- start:559 stop:987 length:429 start_codon:yes stop_codon:yes gene_type:complete
MTFATATIQGYVTFKKSSTTPSGRSVVNMYVAVPNKRENMTTSDTYKVSVWDNQALSAAEYISAERKQLVTFSGQLKLDEYSVEQGAPKMRLDFASILDYGNSKPVNPQLTDKQKFSNMIDDIETTKETTAKIKETRVRVKK